MCEKQEGSQRSWSEWRERGGGRSIVFPEGSFKSLLLPLFPLSSLIWARLSSHGLWPHSLLTDFECALVFHPEVRMTLLIISVTFLLKVSLCFPIG